MSYDDKGSWLNPLLDFNLLTLELSLKQQTFNTNIALKLGRLFLAQYYKDTIIPLVDTPNEDENQYLLLMKYILVNINIKIYAYMYTFKKKKITIIIHFCRLIKTLQNFILLIIMYCNCLN